jgi:hypothetical protein
MALQVGGTTVIDNSRVLQNVTGLKTINSNSILGSGDITISADDVKADGYAYANNNQYGLKSNSPGFNVGKYITSGNSATAGSFNNGSFTTGTNQSGYVHCVFAVRTG